MLCVNPQLVVGPGNFLWFSLLSSQSHLFDMMSGFRTRVDVFPLQPVPQVWLGTWFPPHVWSIPSGSRWQTTQEIQETPQKITSLLFFSLLTHFSHGVSLKSAILMMQHFLMISTGKACFSAVIIWNISIIWGFFQLKNCEISNSIGIYSARLPRLNLSYQSDFVIRQAENGLLV